METETDVLKYVAAALSLISIFGVALGLGSIFSGYMNAVSRNPSVEPKLKGIVMIGAGMTEALGILSVIVAILILFVA